MIRLLLVEDNQPQLERTRQILAQNFPGYDIQTASTLNEAIELINKFKVFSLVITDFKLAEDASETGYKLLEYCQERLTDVPVIIVTAHGKDSENEVRAGLSFQKGAFDFMHKPLDFDELIERVKRAINISEALA